MSTNSSERTVTAATAPPSATPNSLATAHHFVSLKLTRTNYLFWRTQLVPFLRGQGLIGYVTGDTPCPPATVTSPATSESGGTTSAPVPNPAHGHWMQQDQSILSLLISSLSDEVMYLAVGRETSRAVWSSVTAALGSSTRARCLNLLAQFQSLRQGESSTGEYLGRAQLLVEDLALAGRPVSLDEQNLYVFRGLRPEFRSMASSLATAGTPVSIPQLSDYLQAQEFIWADELAPVGVAPSGTHALVAGRGSGGGQRHSAAGGGPRQAGGGQGCGRNNRGRGWQGRGRGGVPRCQICRNQGHTAVHCFRRYDQQQPQANVAVPGGEGVISADGWFPDTGATSHATPDPSMMSHSDPYNGGDVLRVGNGSGLGISSIGHASLNSVSRSLHLNDILHVPNLSVPLLSVNRFTADNDVFFEFHRDFFVVKDCRTKAVLLKGPSTGGLYKLSRSRSQVAYISSRASSAVWHRRLGHPHDRALQRVLQTCPVSPTNTKSLQLCSACQLGKSSRFPLDRVAYSSNNVLDLVYTDIWGPTPVVSAEGF